MFSSNTITLLVAFLLLQGSACSAQSGSSIKGNITRSKDWKPLVYLVQPRNFREIASNYSGWVVDSAVLDAESRFVFPNVFQTDEKTLFQLCVQKAGNRFPNQLTDDNPLISNYMPVVLQKGEQLEIMAEADRFQASFSIKNPAEENLALLRLRDIRRQTFQKEQPWLGTEAQRDENALLEHEDAVLRFRAPLMAFADSSAYIWPAMVAARWVSPESDYERVPEFMIRQCEKWRAKMPESQWVVQLCQTGNRENLPVLTGDMIPDFPLPMEAGDTLGLHALLGSRLTILDIWASWCAPCRRENREVLSPLWAQHKDRGLQVLGYSIDSSPAAWKAAIAKDAARWPHASHLSGDATPFLEMLRITTIPANFIIDAQGKVLAKNLHGEALRVFVEAYLK